MKSRIYFSSYFVGFLMLATISHADNPKDLACSDAQNSSDIEETNNNTEHQDSDDVDSTIACKDSTKRVPSIATAFQRDTVGELPSRFINPIALCKKKGGSREKCHTFFMGCSTKEKACYSPRHRVKITREYEIAVTELTQLQWLIVMNRTELATPSEFNQCTDSTGQATYALYDGKGFATTRTICENHPVENISYSDILLFLDRLNRSQDQYTYRLPTEAEWEYAIRGGVKNHGDSYPIFHYGNSEEDLIQYENYNTRSSMWGKLSGKNAEPVAQRKPNGYGLYDMAGNVSEFVFDYFDESYGLSRQQLEKLTINPIGPSESIQQNSSIGGFWKDDERLEESQVVTRGGNWLNESPLAYSSHRSGLHSTFKSGLYGVRLARTPRKKAHQ